MGTHTRLAIVLMSGAALCLAAAPVPAGTAPASVASGTQAGAGLPADVNPDSRNRLATPAPDPAGGPAAAAGAIRNAGTGVNARWESPVGRPLLELAILITAREHDAPFEWSLHEMEAVAVGLAPDVIDVVRNREPGSGLGDREAVIVEVGREIFGAHRLSAETYRRAVTLFGEANFVDVVDLMARYAGTAARLAAFNLLPAPAETTRATPSLYGRTLSPQGTGPGQIGGHGAGRASLEANVARPLLDLAILVTARAYDVQYAWTLTEPAALAHGLAPAVIDVVRASGPTTGLSDEEAALIAFGRELFGPHTVSPETYASAVAAVGGTTNLVDLVDLMAQHVSDATLLIAFGQHLPAGHAPLLTVP